MRKIVISILFLTTALFGHQILFANENRLVNNVVDQKKDFDLEISDLQIGNLKKSILDRLGSRDLNNVKKLTVISGQINNNDYQFISEELVNLKTLDLSSAFFEEKEALVLFNEKSKIEEFHFPKSKAGYKLADNFFKNNKRLNKVELNGVKSLGKYAFENTTSLRNIDLSEVDTFDTGVFSKSGIENITFKQSYDLPEEFFKDTKSLSNIDISDAKTIGKAAFMGSNIEYIKMPESYGLDGYTFAKTKNLISVDLSGATRLGEGDFLESSIEEVTFPSKYSLPDFYFSKTKQLREIDISNADEIGVGVFAFSNIEKVNFPEEFNLSEGLLQYTEQLDEIDVSNAQSIKEAVFAGSSLSEIILPEKFEVSNAMFGFMENLKSIDLSGAEVLSANIFVKSGSNYDYYRKFFDGSDLVSNIKGGVETIILGKTVPAVASNSFGNLNGNPPIILLPKSQEWDAFSHNLMDKDNEIKNLLRYDSYTYSDLMISKDTLIQIGFLNPIVESYGDEKIDAKYQWYFNDNEIINANQSAFTIDNFTINDEGRYRLEIMLGSKTYKLFDINLEANELAIDANTLYKGFFLNETIEESLVNVLYVKDEFKQTVSMDDLEYDYDFSEVGNTNVKVTYKQDDLTVVADYPVKVANTLTEKIKIKKGKTFTYDPMIDGFEFIPTANQKEYIEIEESEESSAITIKAKEKYKGELDFKFNGRVGQVELEVVSNLLFLWIGLGVGLIVLLAGIIYLRETRGMFKVKKKN